MKWDGSEAAGAGLEFEIVAGKRFKLDKDGRKVNERMDHNSKIGDEEPCFFLRRRYMNPQIGMSRWGVLGSFATIEAAKAYAENI